MSTAPSILLSAAPTAPVDDQLQRLIAPTLPFSKRILYFIQLWFIKVFVSTALALKPILKPSSKASRPTFIKAYPCRPRLKNRIFVPRSHKAGEILPLYISVHGGGFVIGDPIADDEFCFRWANQFNILVVSINYAKAPSAKFPIPTHDVAAISQAVIDDDSLPIDRSRVAMGGFSAGGALVLSAVQLPALKGKVKAVIPWYPVTDLSIGTELKQKTRPYRTESEVDKLLKFGPMCDYGYIPPGQHLRDPLLSPSYAKASDLPEYIYTIGAEYDLLAHEAWVLMCRLTGITKPSEEERYEFERGKYKWTLIRDVDHGFSHEEFGLSKEEKKRLLDVCDKMYAEAGEWLLLVAFANK